MLNNLNQRKPLFYTLAALFAVMGILVTLDIKNYTYSGFQTDGVNTVTVVYEDSPAEKAGMQVGDYMKSIDGISANDWKGLNQVNRRSIGQTVTYVMDRNGSEETLNLALAAQPANNRMVSYIGRSLGFIYLLMGLWIFTTSAHPIRGLFALFAIIFSTTFFGGLYVENPSMRSIINGIQNILFIAGFPFLVRFLLEYPPKSSFLENKNLNYVLFLPAILYGIISFALNVILPTANDSFSSILNAYVGLTILFYFGWALFLLVQKYRQSSAGQRQNNGTNLLLAGVIIGLVPLLILVAVSVISPKTVLPGANYYFLSLGAIPILFAMGIKRLAGKEIETDLQVGVA